MSPPRLSVIIPTYNRADFVRQCLGGLKQSGVDDLEVIVGDDGSTDGTEAVVREVDPAAIYFRQENTGTPATARNRGFRMSRGRYVGFLDCDDQWLPGQPARAVELLDRHPEVDVLFADAEMGNPEEGYRSWIESGGQAEFFALPHRELEPGFRVPEPDPFFRRMAERNPVFIGAVIMRREAFEASGGFDERLCGAADWNLWLRMAARFAFGYWSEPLAIYYQHPAGMSKDHDGMSREFCDALRWLPGQAELTPAQRRWAADQLRHHLFSYAYRAYDRGEVAEARARFSDLLATSGPDLKGLLFRGVCALPEGVVARMRGAKHRVFGGGGPRPEPWQPLSKAAVGRG